MVLESALDVTLAILVHQYWKSMMMIVVAILS